MPDGGAERDDLAELLARRGLPSIEAAARKLPVAPETPGDDLAREIDSLPFTGGNERKRIRREFAGGNILKWIPKPRASADIADAEILNGEWRRSDALKS